MKRLIKFFLIIVFTFVLIGIGMALFSTVPADSLNNLQTKMDAVWWSASIIRWLLILVLILFVVPWFLRLNLNKLQARGEGLVHELERADSENASYETRVSIESRLYETEKMHDLYENLQQRRWLIGIGLIAVELIAVQLPHLI